MLILLMWNQQISITKESVFLYTCIDLDVEINTKKQNFKLVNMSESQSIKIGSKKMYKPSHSEKAFTIKTLNHSLEIYDLISLVLS